MSESGRVALERAEKAREGIEGEILAESLRQIVGNEIPVIPHESGKHLVARIGLNTEALLAARGSEIFVVAGAGFEPATFGL